MCFIYKLYAISLIFWICNAYAAVLCDVYEQTTTFWIAKLNILVTSWSRDVVYVVWKADPYLLFCYKLTFPIKRTQTLWDPFNELSCFDFYSVSSVPQLYGRKALYTTELHQHAHLQVPWIATVAKLWFPTALLHVKHWQLDKLTFNSVGQTVPLAGCEFCVCVWLCGDGNDANTALSPGWHSLTMTWREKDRENDKDKERQSNS